MGFEPKYGDCDNTLLFKIAEILNAGGGGGGGAGVSSFNTRTGAVTLTSGDISDALGYTPADGSLYVLKAGDTMTGPLQFSGTTNPGIVVNSLTTAQRDAVAAPANGTIIFNTTTARFNAYDNGAWTAGWVRLAGDTMTGALAIANSLGFPAVGPSLSISGIWDTTLATAFKIDIIDAFSDAGSLLIEAKRNLVSQFSVTKFGIVTMAGTLTVTQASANSMIASLTGGSVTGANTTTFFNLAGTWNTSGAPTAFLMNITNTASGAASLLMDVQASAVSQFSIAKDSSTLITRTQADTSGAVLALQKTGTTGNAAAAVASGDTISSIEARGFDGTSQGTAYTFRALALEAFTNSAHGSRIVIGIPSIGSTTATARFDLRATALALSNGCSMNVALGTITAAQLVYDGSVTWNAAVTFTAHRITVTNTSSNAASLLCNYIVGASSVFAVRVDGQIQKNGVELMNPLSVYAAGTVYTLTTTNAKVDFGTTDPVLTLNAAGTYRLSGSVKIQLNAATFAANQTVTVLLRRTNNTAANITNSGSTFTVPIVTTQTQTLAIIRMNDIHYTTANADDVIEIWADVSVLPSAGTISIDAASLTAIRIA